MARVSQHRAGGKGPVPQGNRTSKQCQKLDQIGIVPAGSLELAAQGAFGRFASARLWSVSAIMGGVEEEEAGYDIQLPDRDQAVTPETFGFKLNWQKLREAPRREGRPMR